ncbi:MAG TPA: hypothetical protein VNF47_28170 [Streptosporangiaceae bacterium]|nr:hypothetical protein [Streptosporangiaceae bacterium]
MKTISATIAKAPDGLQDLLYACSISMISRPMSSSKYNVNAYVNTTLTIVIGLPCPPGGPDARHIGPVPAVVADVTDTSWCTLAYA